MATTDRYNGNRFLPKANTPKEYTSNDIQEVIKCMNDPVYFAKTYFKIVHVDHGLIPFELYEYQIEAINRFQNSRNLIINASRQCGKTSVATVIILHFALFNPNKNIAILANKGATSREILNRIKIAYEYLPDFLKGGVKEWNKGSVVFENGSKIFAEATSSDSVRGQAIALLYIDEHAFIPNWDDFSASVLPTLSSGKETKMVFTSTPNGLNHYYYYVKGAREEKNDFALVEVPWTRVPGRDEKWKQKTLSDLNGDLLKFEQEYNLLFEGSSGTLINGNALKSLTPIQPVHFDANSSQYVRPIENHTYVISADVSRGKGLDYSAFSVIDISTTPYEQVFVYRNNLITPIDYASIILHIAKLYNNAYILVEINDLGQQVADFIYDDEYENLLGTQNKGKKGKILASGFGNKIDRGIRTTVPVKAVGCASLKLLIEQGKLLIKDKNTIQELSTFSKVNNSYGAEPGNHDDLVMGLVLFSWMSLQKLFKDLFDQDIMRTIREKTEEELSEEMLPFGFVQNGLDFYNDSTEVHTVDDLDSWMRT